MNSKTERLERLWAVAVDEADVRRHYRQQERVFRDRYDRAASRDALNSKGHYFCSLTLQALLRESR